MFIGTFATEILLPMRRRVVDRFIAVWRAKSWQLTKNFTRTVTVETGCSSTTRRFQVARLGLWTSLTRFATTISCGYPRFISFVRPYVTIWTGYTVSTFFQQDISLGWKVRYFSTQMYR